MTEVKEELVLINLLVDRMSMTENERLGVSDPGIPRPNRRHALEDLITTQLQKAGTGYCDGGGGGIDGRADIFCYGPDGEALWASIEGLVRPLLSNADAKILIRKGYSPESPSREFEL
jgi:hypothetical protein